MSDGVKFVFKTLFKVPIFILAAYLLMNVLGIVTTYFKVQGIQYGTIPDEHGWCLEVK